MSLLTCITDLWEFNRLRTLMTLDDIAKQPDPTAVLGWRPGPGRAHIAWQLMHVGVTEELFATERLFGLLENHPSDEVIVLPTEIIYRRSCGCQ